MCELLHTSLVVPRKAVTGRSINRIAEVGSGERRANVMGQKGASARFLVKSAIDRTSDGANRSPHSYRWPSLQPVCIVDCEAHNARPISTYHSSRPQGPWQGPPGLASPANRTAQQH